MTGKKQHGFVVKSLENDLALMNFRAGTCVSHHHACDCREYQNAIVLVERNSIAKQLQEVRDLEKELRDESGDVPPSDSYTYFADKLAAIFAKV